MSKTKTKRFKNLIAALALSCLSSASAFAQNPQWVMAQPPTVPDPTNSNFTNVVFNYFLSAQEREEPYFINRISEEYKNTNGQRLNFDRIYGSYYNRQSYDLYHPSNFKYSDQEIPAFIIGKETNHPSSQIKIWGPTGNATSWVPYTFLNNTSPAHLFDGLNGTDL